MVGTGKFVPRLLYLLVFIGGFLLFKRRFEAGFGKNECGMTFMWRQIMLMDVGFEQYNKYTMFLYGEGRYAQYFQHTRQLDGIPIIFVPGNAGSGKQVRSLASVLQNKTESRVTKFHFDVFAVDFNEEFSGIHSTYLLEHTGFVKNAIKHIWSMYKTPPPGIILYGHSLGGVVSRLVLEEEGIRQKVAMVFALASPFKEPPFPIDDKMIRIWERMHSLQTNVPTFSIDGGLRDELIDPDWTRSPFALHASSTEIDDVWLETDHQCIVWCNQFVRQNTRFLFDYARSPSRFSENHPQLFKKHFKTSRQYVKPTKSSENSSFVSGQECTPKCPTSGILKLDSTLDETKTLALISMRFSSQLTSNGKVVGDVHMCGNEKICAFYSGTVNEGVLDLKGKEAWVLDSKRSRTSMKPLPLFSIQEITIKFIGMHILHLDLTNPLLAYRIQITSNQQIERAIFVTEKSKRLATPGESRKQQEIVANLENSEDSDARLYFFGSEQTELKLVVELDVWISLVKILRSIRTLVVPSLIGLHLIFGLVGKYTFLVGVVPLAILWQNNPVQVFATFTFVSLIYAFISAFNVLISPIFKLLNRRGVSIGLAVKSISFVVMLLGASQTHPFPFALIAGIWIACALPDSSNLLIWIELFLFTQFPAGFEFFFGLRKYRQIIYAWSLFGSPALIFIVNCGAFLAFKLTKPRSFSVFACVVLEFFVVLWLLRGKSLNSLIALDSLGLLCALLTSLELDTFRVKVLKLE